ncbi:MAG: type IV secretion system DNA-binding domain-containing protein [Deltaproteobacteria bacterium]|jgi:G3E family GTPase|nr:type IV secretion system DNA-binding domain-containing protein [Deltaproteobacteria bacterium]
MRVVSVSGTRGSGKTTLIRELIAHFNTRNKNSAVIVNEEGQAVYDADFVLSHDITLEYIRGG